MKKKHKTVFTLIALFFLCIYLDKGYGDTITKQEFLFMPKGSPPAAMIDVLDLRQADLDTKLAAITLQGHVNAGEKSRICLLVKGLSLKGEVYSSPSEFWLKWFKEKNYIRDFRSISLTDFFSKYSSYYDKVIVYDPNLPASINIATMIGAVERGIVIAPCDVDRFGKRKKTEDLRGRWATNVQAYEWALDNLWPRMNHNILASQHPTFADHALRDYLVRNKIFQYWVTGKNAEDGIVSSYDKELEFAKKVLALTPPSTPVIGWLDGGAADHGMTEYGGVGLMGQYGKFMIPNNWGENFSLISGITVNVPKMFADHKKKTQSACPELKQDKVYLSLAIQESGDAPFYWQHFQKTVWQDEQRGKFPINWCLALSCLETCPAIIEWFFEHATPNDHFYISISGLGYAHPYREFFKHTPDPESGWRKYLSTIQRYLNLTGMREMGLYTDAWLPYDRKKHDPVTLRFAELSGLDMLVVGMGRDEGIMKNDGHNYLIGQNRVLASHSVTRWDSNNIGRNDRNNNWLTEEIRRNTPVDRPAFIVVTPLSWSYYPSDLAQVLSRLGPEYVPVSLRDFKTLYQEAAQVLPLSDFWSGNGEFVVDTKNQSFGSSFDMHFISTIWDSGTLYAYYIVNKPDGKFAVGLATSIDGIAFVNQGIVVDVGAAGQWDDERASFPGIWKDGVTWYMAYEGSPGGFDPAAIGLARSQDGMTWTKEPSNPILTKSGTGFMSHEIGTPSLWKEGRTWYLFYHGFDLNDCQIGVATGTNILNLTHYSTTVPRVPTSDSDWDAGTTGHRSIIKEGRYYYMVYEGSTDQPYITARWSSGIARSTDLLSWTKSSRNPIIPQTISGMGYDGPDIVKTPDNTLHIYYRSPNRPTVRATLTK